MIIALILQDEPMNPILRMVFLSIFFIGMGLIVLSRFYIYFEQVYAYRYRKPFFRNLLLIKKRLPSNNRAVLNRDFIFYSRLSQNQKKVFEHRLVRFIQDKTFIGRENIEVTEEMQLLIGATAIMLTFGYRDYLISIISNIIIYPDSFYSRTNNELHNGEFNPQLATLVLSWKHFKEGYDIDNDNLNLGIHEFAHAIHLNSLYSSGINSIIFNESFKELKTYLDNNEEVKARLIQSRYFREYAYTNQFEFVAVIIETFIETPKLFKKQFPVLFKKVSLMLNFRNILA